MAPFHRSSLHELSARRQLDFQDKNPISNLKEGAEMLKVEIYTAQMCGYCHRALQLLDSKGIEYKQIDVSMSSSLRDEMRSRAGGNRTVPQIFIDGDHIGGSDDLYALERAKSRSVACSMNSCRVAALQYCASATAADTLPRLLDMIARAARGGSGHTTGSHLPGCKS